MIYARWDRGVGLCVREWFVSVHELLILSIVRSLGDEIAPRDSKL